MVKHSSFVVRKVVHVGLVLLLVSLAVTFLINLTPGDPAYAIVGDQATPEQVAEVHRDLHLDEPLYNRYLQWLGQIVRDDFGTSYQTQRKVTDLILERLPVTVELIGLTLILALAVSIPLGIYTAYRADTLLDRTWMLASSVLVSIPPFVSALLLVYVLAVRLRNLPINFPATGWVSPQQNIAVNLWYLFLPALTLALIQIPNFSRPLRADMIGILQQEYILAARSRGIPTKRILVRHALRPSSFSLVTLAGLSLGGLIGGAVIVETLFALPGLGSLIVQSIFNKDLPVVQGTVMFIAIVYVLLNTSLDLVYRVLDPRVRLDPS